jgi:hypothetical protein
VAETDEEKRAREEREAKDRTQLDAKGGKGGPPADEKLDPEDEADIDLIREVLDCSEDDAKALQKSLKTRWKGEARKWERRAKENADKAKKYDEVEAKGKSAEDRLADLEKKGAAASAEAIRLRVAMRKGLTETQAKRLVGTTEEELEADADELLESWKPVERSEEESEDKNGGRERQRVPRERLRPAPRTGARGRSDDDVAPSKDDVKKIVDRVMEPK